MIEWITELGYNNAETFGSETEMITLGDSVIIKVSEPINNASLIIAEYSNEQLTNVNIRTVSTDSSLEIRENVTGFDGMYMIKVFL